MTIRVRTSARRPASLGPATLVLAGLLLSGGGVVAQGTAQEGEPAACAVFDWSLRREQAWFAAPGLPALASGATLSPDLPGAVLSLKPQAEAGLPFPPSREPKPGTYGGVLNVPAPVTPGLYQITLSDSAWVDVSQDGRTTRNPVATTMRPGCPGLSKSLRFQFGATPIIIAVSGAKSDTIRIAVAPVD